MKPINFTLRWSSRSLRINLLNKKELTQSFNEHGAKVSRNSGLLFLNPKGKSLTITVSGFTSDTAHANCNYSDWEKIPEILDRIECSNMIYAGNWNGK